MKTLPISPRRLDLITDADHRRRLPQLGDATLVACPYCKTYTLDGHPCPNQHCPTRSGRPTRHP